MILRRLEIPVEDLLVGDNLDVVLRLVWGVSDEEERVGGRERLAAVVHDGAIEVGDSDLGVGHKAVTGYFHGVRVCLDIRNGDFSAVAFVRFTMIHTLH